MASHHKKIQEKAAVFETRGAVLPCNMSYAGCLANSAAEDVAAQGAHTTQLLLGKSPVLDLLTDCAPLQLHLGKNPVLDLLTDCTRLPSVGQGIAGSALLCRKGQTLSAGGAGDQEKSTLRCWMPREAAASLGLRSRVSVP